MTMGSVDRVQGAITRRGWLLFGLMGIVWGLPYLLIKVAVKHLEPPVIVFGRTSLAALVLTIIAARAGALRPALAHWRIVVTFAAIEMAGPWWLLTDAERTLPSGLTGLLVACVPIVGAIVAYVLGDRSALRALRVFGIGCGLGGVALLVGHDLGGSNGIPWRSVIQVLVVCVGYATAPFIASRRLADVPTLGVIALSLGAVAIAYAPWAWLSRPDVAPPGRAWLAVLTLAVVCTGVAFVAFFALIGEVGPARATFITFINPAVAVVLGALLLHERITAATIAGFALVLGGCWFATRPTRDATPMGERVSEPEGVAAADAG